MQIVHGHAAAPTWARAAIAIGNFDGVHVGHRALIARARALAAARDALTCVLTFDPHPTALLAPARAPAMVSTLARRLELFADAGVDAVIVEPFTHALAGASPEAFLDDVVIAGLRACAIVVGYDFSYGQGRTGNVDALRAHGAAAGVDVAIVPAVEIDGEIAASTQIRARLRAGDLAGARRMLGRPWDVDGVVVHGAERGRALGYPTANIAPELALPVAPGIYVVTLAVDGGPPLPAVASLGTNPTFVDGGDVVLEVHVLDWRGDLYDRRVRTTFLARLRDEQRFDSVEALVVQIERDLAAARAQFAGA